MAGFEQQTGQGWDWSSKHPLQLPLFEAALAIKVGSSCYQRSRMSLVVAAIAGGLTVVIPSKQEISQ